MLKCMRSVFRSLSCFQSGHPSYFLGQSFATLPWFEKCNIYNHLPKMGKKAAPSFYAVAHGRVTGIFHTWKDCEAQVTKFSGARFKSFKSEEEAKNYIKEFALPSDKPKALTQPFEDQKSTVTKLPNTNNKSLKPLDPEEFDELQKKGYDVLKKAGFDVKTPPEAGTVGASASRRGRTKRDVSRNSASEGKEPVANKRLKLTDSVEEGATASGDSEGFMRDPSGYVIVFTDGACSNNGKNCSKAGIGVWFGAQHYLNISEPVQGRQTNNTAEIQAAARAILQAKNAGINKLNVKTDSKFVISCITDWINKWKKNGWKLRSGKEVINRVDLEKLEQATAGMDIKWTYVPGHQGHVGNEAADRLAVEGASKCPCP